MTEMRVDQDGIHCWATCRYCGERIDWLDPRCECGRTHSVNGLSAHGEVCRLERKLILARGVVEIARTYQNTMTRDGCQRQRALVAAIEAFDAKEAT